MIDDAVVSFYLLPRGADLDTDRIATMVAEDGIHLLGNGRYLPSSRLPPCPEDIGGEEMLLFAGDHTGITSDTSLEVNDMP